MHFFLAITKNKQISGNWDLPLRGWRPYWPKTSYSILKQVSTKLFFVNVRIAHLSLQGQQNTGGAIFVNLDFRVDFTMISPGPLTGERTKWSSSFLSSSTEVLRVMKQSGTRWGIRQHFLSETVYSIRKPENSVRSGSRTNDNSDSVSVVNIVFRETDVYLPITNYVSGFY